MQGICTTAVAIAFLTGENVIRETVPSPKIRITTQREQPIPANKIQNVEVHPKATNDERKQETATLRVGVLFTNEF